MSGDSTFRRIPQQARGQRRVEKILDATAQLIEEKGYEHITTNAIAARADTSIGSLYQFFPNKQAIINALTNRYIDDIKILFDQILTQEPDTITLPVLLTKMIDALTRYYETSAGFKTLFYGTQTAPQLNDAALHIYKQIVLRLKNILSYYMPHKTPVEHHLYANVMLSIIKALLPYTPYHEDNDPDALTHECKQAITAYLTTITPYQRN